MSNKKRETLFVCSNCGFESRKWLGRCLECGEWDTLIEQVALASKDKRSGNRADEPVLLSECRGSGHDRLYTGISELDRVLGGGIVPGSLVLIGGDPGIGKSTLILQMLATVAGAKSKVLYVTGEESARQVRMRADRLQVDYTGLYLATENCVEEIIAMAKKMSPVLLAVDSIQTMFSEDISSAPGSVSQVRESAARLLSFGKGVEIPIFLVGHVTKDGAIAGPRVLEHMVDTVLYFEGDRGQVFRVLRTVKNRFGSTNEIGVFEMQEKGLVEVENPSALFLSERPLDVSGSVVMAAVEGTRPILVEVQALVSPTNLGTARRTAIGADQQRLSLLTAVLEKKLGVNMIGHDIFLNIAGGVRVDEPALDLAVVVALLSSFFDQPVSSETVVCGEVGLAGEVRGVGQMEMRINEAQRLGFSSFIMPESSQINKKTKLSIEPLPVATIHEVASKLFGADKR